MNWMLLYFFTFFMFVLAHSKFICKNGTSVNGIHSDEIAFFETLDFPKVYKNFNYNNCSMQFMVNDTTQDKNIRGLLVITNIISYYLPVYVLPPKLQVFNDSIFVKGYYREPNGNLPYIYEAMQGFVLFDDWGSEACPLESISREDPFHFTNETQIIYLQSNYPNSSRTHPCLWQFSAPKGYGFKFVIQQLNITAQAQLTIYNSTNIIQTERSVQLNTPYYNSDNNIKIYLSNSSTSSNTEFGVYLTLIKNQWETVKAGCTIYKEGNTTFWGNMNLNANPIVYYRYPSNGKCSYDLIVRKGFEMRADITMMTEPYIDYIEYFDDLTNITETLVSKDTYTAGYNNGEIEYSYSLYFTANDDGSDKLIKWNFVSDGSVEYLGFNIIFTEKNCSCSNSTIILTDNLVIIGIKRIGFTDIHPYQQYCINLRCNFTVQMNSNYLKPFFYFDFSIYYNYVKFDDSVRDIYRIFSNNKLVFDISRNNLPKNNYNQYSVFLPSSAITTIEIITTDNNYFIWNKVVFQIIASDRLEVLNRIVLTEENPIYGYDSGRLVSDNEFVGTVLFTVEIQSTKFENDATIEIFSNLVNTTIVIYDNENLTTILSENDCFDINFPFTCKIKGKYFAIVIMIEGNIVPYLLFKASIAKPDGCAFENNVFILNEQLHQDQIISTVANKYDTCKIFVILTRDIIWKQVFYLTKNLWTSSKKENVKVYAGYDEKKLILNFNAQSASTFKKILLVTTSYMIEIPKSSGIIIKLQPIDRKFMGSLTINVESYPFQSVFTTIDYGITTFKHDELTQMSVQYNLNDSLQKKIYNFKFTVLDYNITSKSKCWFETPKENKKYVTKTNESFIFHETTLNYLLTKNVSNAGILFHVELIKLSN